MGSDTKMVVYVVDDDDAVRDSLRILLESHGLTVEDFGTAPDFAQHYRHHARECLLLDHNLPGINGLDFLASPAGAGLHLPVILMTGAFDRTIRERAKAAGVAAFLQKPIASDALLAAIKEASVTTTSHSA
jgi:two-component system response regulator FixJ